MFLSNSRMLCISKQWVLMGSLVRHLFYYYKFYIIFNVHSSTYLRIYIGHSQHCTYYYYYKIYEIPIEHSSNYSHSFINLCTLQIQMDIQIFNVVNWLIETYCQVLYHVSYYNEVYNFINLLKHFYI